MTSEEVLDIFKSTGALMEGHFILSSGYHSPYYFQCAKVLQYPRYNNLLASAISGKFNNKDIDVVISPAVGGIVFGTAVGSQLGARTIFTERENGKMTLRRGYKINEGENVLICEDVVTTGGSVLEIIEIVKDKKANLIGVGFIIDRSNGKVNFKTEQYSLAKLEVKNFKDDELPDWLAEIPLTKPGSREL
jgi:orotate phosphoribosyltransferase